MNKKAVINFLITYSVIFCILIFFIKLFLKERTLLENLHTISWMALIPQIIFGFMFDLTNSFTYKELLKSFSVHLKFKEWFGLGCINTLANYLFPFKTGTMARAAYLKNKYNLNISENLSISVFAAFFYLEMLLILSAIFLTLAPIMSLNVPPNAGRAGTYFFVLFVLGLIFLMGVRKTHIKNDASNPLIQRMTKILQLFIDGLKIISSHKNIFILLITMNLFIFTIQGCRLYFAFYALNLPLTLYQTFIMNLLTCLGSLVSITPGNFGIQEIIITLSAQLAGLTREQGFIASAIIRLTAIVQTLVFGLFFYIMLDMQKILSEKK